MRHLTPLAVVVMLATSLLPASLVAQATLAMPQNGIVDLTMSGGRVDIRGWDRAELSMEGNDSFEASRTSSGAQVRRISGRRSSSTLYLRVPSGTRVVVNGSSTDVTIADIAGEVEVRITTGDVRLSQIGGRAIVSSISGDIRLTGGGSDVRVRTASGDVMLRDVRGAIDVNTTSGDIAVFDSRARGLLVETMSGDVDFRGRIDDDGSTRIATHGGDVRLELPEDARAMLEMRTFSGRINSARPLVLMPTGTSNRRDVTRRLQLGSTGGPVIAIATFSGNITVASSASREQR